MANKWSILYPHYQAKRLPAPTTKGGIMKDGRPLKQFKVEERTLDCAESPSQERNAQKLRY
jgi:hypothetical protein